MTPLLKRILFALLAWPLLLPAQDEAPLGPDDALVWLQSLATEARIDLTLEDAPILRLFNETVPDGRTWMTFIADQLGGSGHTNWAVMDEAVMVLLTEADRMKELAAESAGTVAEAKFANARRAYLQGAAYLLDQFKTASNEVYDNTIGLLPDAAGIPDWALPGEIEIREAAGAARINVETGEFGGRLSGEIGLPKFNADLVLQNASFDSRGNIDLSAYGSASFPPDSAEQVTLSILSRRPFIFHLSEDGDFRVAGSGRIELPDGNRFEAYFDADDPNYEFGIAFSGSLTLDLAKELTLLRPTIPADPSLEAIDGFAQFFGAFGKGLETFVEESPDFPSSDDLDLGVAPEFKPPQTAVPFDVFDAWLVALSNDHVRPALNGASDDALSEVSELLGGMKSEIAAARREVAPSLNEIKRLARLARANGRVREILDASRDAFEAGNEEESNRLLEEAGVAALEAEEIAIEYLVATPGTADFKTGLAAIETWIEASRMTAALGGTDIDESVLAASNDKLDQWSATALERYGYGRNGTVIDAAKANALSATDLRTLLLMAIEVNRMQTAFGGPDTLPTPLMTALTNAELNKTHSAYEAAKTDDDDELRAQYGARLMDIVHVRLSLDIAVSAADQTRVQEVLTQAGEQPALMQAARRLLELENEIAARRKNELFGRAEGNPALVDRVEFAFVEQPPFERWYRTILQLKDAGFAAAVSGELEGNLASLMRFYAQAQSEQFSDGDLIEQNLEGAYEALLVLSDLLAIADEMGDVALLGELEPTWQALHIEWVPVAEARRAHWYLSAYARELAAASSRYGDGVASALLSSFEISAAAAVDALALVTDALADVVDGFGVEAFQFALPGDLEVQRLFGKLAFNRISGEWDVDFGGRLFFDDYDLLFEIPEASLASSGDFSLSLLTDGPVPFGFEESLSLSTSFMMTGNVLTPSLDNALAMGQLIYTPPSGTPGVYDISLAYAFDDPPGSHTFDVTASFTDQQELFTKDLVIFEGGFGFALSTDAAGVPQQGGAEVEMTVGILLRDEAASKAIDELTEEDFWLKFEGMAALDFSTTASFVEVSLNSGELFLPPDIFSAEDDPAMPAKASLLRPLCVRFDFATNEILFCDETGELAPGVRFENIVAAIPGLEGAELTIDLADLGFDPANALPVLENLEAELTLPLPGADASDPESNRNASLVVAGSDWSLTGLPAEASLALGSDLRLLDLDGFTVDVLALAGEEIGDCPPGLSFVHDEASGATRFSIASGMRVSVDPDLIWDAGENAALSAVAAGCFSWMVGEFPEFALETLVFSGRFRIGGEEGIELKGADGADEASIAFMHLENLFERPPADVSESFRIELQGAVNFSDIIEFALLDSAFIWDGTAVNPLTGAVDNLLPRFEPGGVCAVVGQDGIDLIEGILPLYPTELCLRFHDGSLPLFPATGEIGLFDPTNLIVLASGVVTLPNGVAVEGGSPGISGAVQGVEFQFMKDATTGFPIPDFPATVASIDGITLRVENLDIPPLGGITGGLHLGNLDAALAGNPEDLFFAGQLGAKVNDIGAEVLLAAKPVEFVGACFTSSAGPAGIPIDGGVLGGVLLTGGGGGINFKNSYSNPCAFETYISFTSGPDGEMIPMSADFPEIGENDDRPVGGSPPDMDALNEEIAMDLTENPVTHDDPLPPPPDCILPMSPDFNCITGPFPPPSINPLCERIFIDGEERIIFKGTSLSEPRVLDLLELAFPDVGRANLRAHLDALVPGAIIDAFVGQVVGSVQETANAILAGDVDLDPSNGLEFDPAAIDPRAYQFFANKINEIFGSLDDAATNFLREAFHRVLKADPEASLYDILLTKAAEGIPCFDITLRLEGTLSHSAISSVLSGTGALTVSSTGTAVLDGSINLVGIPVGTATLAFSLTNPSGGIDPSFGGVAEVALGPLELGRMTMSLGCPGCYEAIQMALLQWMVDNAALFEGAVLRPFLIQMMDRAAPRRDVMTGDFVARSTAISVEEHFLDLTDEERFAWMSSFLNLFQIVVDNSAKALAGEAVDPLPVSVSPATLDAFLGSFRTLLVDILTEVNPRICFGGDIGPKIFGFPLTGGAEGSLGGGLLYQKVEDPITGVPYQELVAQMKFSPSQLLASSVLGSYAFTLPTAVDQAQMGYSLRMNAFTEENIETLLTDPAKFAGDQITTLVEDSVLSFGYQLQPLGYQLANGQGRVIMPRIGGHPLNPNRFRKNPDDPENPVLLPEWVNPDDFMIEDPENPGEFIHDPALPTRMELILAALSKGQLQNPLWRGTPEDLATLFSLPGSDCYVPSNSGCDLLTLDVAERIDPARLGAMDMAVDYFPHGGLIGGAELALPNMIAKSPPAERLAQLLTFPTFETFGDWLANAQVLFGDPADTTHPDFDDPGYAYFTGTLCSGQMAFYLPAPNPPGFDWANGSVDEFISSVQTGDFQGIIDRTLPEELYPADLILLRGWLDAPIFGLPVARGQVDYDPLAGCFTLHTSILNEIDPDGEEGASPPVPNWLYDFVGGFVDFQIKAPERVAATTGPDDVEVGGALEDLAAFGARAREDEGAEAIAFGDVDAFIGDLQASMPKVSLETGANFVIPGELSALMRREAEAEVEFFAFSPAFDPDFEMADDSPYALAKRRGGMGLRGSFELGYFPETLPAEQHLIISVPDASIAMFPSTDISVFPALAGQFVVDTIQLPGTFSFAGDPETSFEFRNGLVQFNSSPDVGEDYLEVAGQMSPIDLGPFLQVTPLPVDANEDDLLGGALKVQRTETAAAVAVSLNPAQATIPLFGSLAGKIYGGSLNHDTLDTDDIPGLTDALDDTQPFTFSTFPGQPWSAVVQLDGTLQVRHPFDLEVVLFEAEPVMQDGVQVPFLAQVEGIGLEEVELRLTIPNGLVFTVFPGTAHASTFQVGSNSATCLLVNTEGRVYFDSGTRMMDLAGGLGEIEGRIELGFEPLGAIPALAHTTPLAVAAPLGSTNDQKVRITNTNSNPSQLVVDASLSDSTHFSIYPPRLTLGARQSAELTLRFAPKAASFVQPVLRLSNNSATPLVEIPLEGVVRLQPRVHVHLSSIDFGLTPMGTTRNQVLRVTNTGDATLQCTNIITTGSAFSEERTTLTISPNQSRDILVGYSPTTATTEIGTLEFNTNDPSRSLVRVPLNGRGSNRFWYRQRRGTGEESLQAVAMRPDGRGHASGLAGAHLFGNAGGQSWTKDTLVGNPDIQAAAAVSNTTAWVVGSTTPDAEIPVSYAARTTNSGTSWQRQTATLLATEKELWHAVTVIPGTDFACFAGGDTGGGGRIVVQTATNSYDQGAVEAGAQTLRGVAFGTMTAGLAVGDRGTILRTLDGGKTWVLSRSLPADFDKETDLLAVAANPFSTERYVVVGRNGVILGTADRGTTWARVKSEATADLHGVVRAGDDRYFIVGDNGLILRGNSAGTSWTKEDAPTDEDFRAVTAIDPHKTTVSPSVWAVTADGGIFHRQTTAISGPIGVVEADELDNLRAAEGEVIIRELRVTNEGVDDLAFGLSTTSGDIEISPAGPQTVPPGSEAVFLLALVAKTGGVFGGTIDVTSSDSALGKEKFPMVVTVRDPFFEPLGYALLPPRIHLGAVPVGENIKETFSLRNIGKGILRPHSLDVRHDHGSARFQIDWKQPEEMAPDSAEEITLDFLAGEPGIYHGFFEFNSDAQNGVAVTEVVVEVVEEAEVVLVRTDPPGLPFSVDHDGVGGFTSYNATTAFTVVDGSPANTTQIQRGKTIHVRAQALAERQGMAWEFKRWRPGSGTDFSFVAGESAHVFTAEYATGPLVSPEVEDPPMAIASPCRFITPPDVTFGPWVRITEARFTLPWLGDGEGTDFEVAGSLFLTLDHARGSLESSRIRVSAPLLDDIEVLEITPSGWTFDIDADGRFALGALTPGVQIMNASAVPPAELALEVDLTQANRRAFLAFATLDELPLQPGVLALGPGSVEFETNVGAAEADLRLAVDGSFRALARPDNPSQWIVNRPYAFELAAAISPVTFTAPTQLVELGVLRIHADTGTTIRPVFDTASIGLEAEHLDVEFFRGGSRFDTSASVDSTDAFTLTTVLPTNGFAAGPVRIKPDTTADTTVFLKANPVEAHLALDMPRIEINSTAGLWQDDRIKTPERLSFDTGNVTFRVPLPGFDFADFAMDNTPSQDADHYVEFSRSTTSMALRVRNRMDLFLGNLKFAFDVNTSGALSGSLSGSMGIQDPPPMNAFSDSVSMSYRMDRNPEFLAHRKVLGIGLRFKCGNGNPIFVQACTLKDGSPDPMADWDDEICVP